MGFRLQRSQRFAYRDSLEITSAILYMCHANSNTRKTHIMYKSNLSYTQLQKYLIFLVSTGLLEKENLGDVEFFKLTKKGDKFLKEYHQIKRLLTVGPVLSVNLNYNVGNLAYDKQSNNNLLRRQTG